MATRETVKCTLCRVDVFKDRLHDPDRCPDPRCPLAPKPTAAPKSETEAA